MDTLTKNNRITCIYCSALNDWRGTSAGLRNLLNLFFELKYNVDLIAYDYYYYKFEIEKGIIKKGSYNTTIHLLDKWPKQVKFLSIIFCFFLSIKPCRKNTFIFAELSLLPSFPAVVL